MPRLTSKDFLARHYFLKRIWEDENLYSLFGCLSPNQQWDLHQYYQVTNTGTDAEIVETRTTVNAGDNSLPQRAGRAYVIIFSHFQEMVEPQAVLSPEEALSLVEEVGVAYRGLQLKRMQTSSSQKQTKVHHSLNPIVQPEIDMEKLAKTLLMLAEYLQNEKRKKNGEPPINMVGHRRH